MRICIRADLNQRATADIISRGLLRAFGRPSADAQAVVHSIAVLWTTIFISWSASGNPPCGHKDGVMLLPPGPRCEVRKGGIKPSQADTSKNVGWGGCPKTLGSSKTIKSRRRRGVNYPGFVLHFGVWRVADAVAVPDSEIISGGAGDREGARRVGRSAKLN